jgi:hypothetical protein
MGSARSGDLTNARRDIEQLSQQKNALSLSKQDYWAEQVEIQRRAALAWIAHAEGKADDVIADFRLHRIAG